MAAGVSVQIVVPVFMVSGGDTAKQVLVLKERVPQTSVLLSRMMGFSFLDYRTGPCYTAVRPGSCLGQLPGVVCTKNLCCATVGKAWGHPCEKCPSELDCGLGYLRNLHSGECIGKFPDVRTATSLLFWSRYCDCILP